MGKATEKKASNILLNRGISLDIALPFFLWIFGKKLKITVKSPTARNFIKIANLFLEMSIENTGEMTLKEAFELVQKHGVKMSYMVTLSIQTIVPNRMLAWLLRRQLSQQELSYLFHLIIAYGGVEDFINTIRLAEATRITKPMNLSPAEEMS